MFTGIIAATGTVAVFHPRGEGARLRVRTPARFLAGRKLGESIAVNGCCLTMIQRGRGFFAADLAPETIARTTLSGLEPGTVVNLEPALRAGDPLGGHLVQGHIEGIGTIVALDPLKGDAGWWMRVRVPAELRRYLIWKGSVTIDGISLTVARLDRGVAGIAIVPHTYAHTNLSQFAPGTKVNLETDPIARYVESLLPRAR